MHNIGIIGCGELGLQAVHIARQQNKYRIAGFFDDFTPAGTDREGVKVLGALDDIARLIETGRVDSLFVAVGYKSMAARKSIYERFAPLGRFATLIHPRSHVDETARIAPGCMLYPGAIIDKAVVLRENVLVNLGGIISHDSDIGAHSFLSPNVAIAGYVSTGECVNLGISTTIIDHVSVGPHVRTGGATVVVENLEKPGLYVGNPARFIR